MKLILNDDLKKHLESFDQIMAIEGKVFRHEKGRKTVRFSLGEKNYFIKLHFGVGWCEIFKDLFQLRLPIVSAKNEWMAIQRFEKLNIPTLRLVGYGERGWNPAVRESFVITEELTNVESLEDVCAHWKKNPPAFAFKRKIVLQLAKIAKTLHRNGINHRDFYLCHFLLDKNYLENKVSDPILYLIDLHRVQIRKKTPIRWVVKDLAGLYFSSLDTGITKRDVLRFLSVYFDLPWKEVLEKHRDFLEGVGARAMRLRRKHELR